MQPLRSLGATRMALLEFQLEVLLDCCRTLMTAWAGRNYKPLPGSAIWSGSESDSSGTSAQTWTLSQHAAVQANNPPSKASVCRGAAPSAPATLIGMPMPGLSCVVVAVDVVSKGHPCVLGAWFEPCLAASPSFAQPDSSNACLRMAFPAYRTCAGLVTVVVMCSRFCMAMCTCHAGIQSSCGQAVD